MKIEREFIVPYSIAIGFFNLIFTTIIVVIAAWAFSFTLTWKMYFESYALGYIILWILNLKSIRE